MLLVPHRVLVQTTELPRPEVRTRLATFIGENRPFAGTVSEDGFSARRRGSLLRFGLPRVDGRLEDEGSGTRLVVTLRLEPLFVGLYLPWLALMLAASAAFASQTMRSGGLALGALGPALLAALVHGMVHASFAGEAAIVRRYLSTLGERPLLRAG